MMFAELERVMAHSLESGNFFEALEQNITGKKSSSGVEKTANHLKKLYSFDTKLPLFSALAYFWKNSDSSERPLIAFIYVVNHDDLLAESIEVLSSIDSGEKVGIELFEKVIDEYHPNRYSVNTRKSLAQNLASTWKQAGFITGKVRNIRTLPNISYKVACFAFLLAYLKGDRGDFIWNSIGVKALCLYESRLRELAIEGAKKDLMQYQYAGSVTAISFHNIINKIGINAV